MFKVEFHKKAVKELKKLDAQIIRIIKQDIDQKLKIDPIGYGEPLRGKLKGCYKLKYKSMNLRLVYTVKQDQLTILQISEEDELEGVVRILSIGERTREKVYKEAELRKAQEESDM